MSGRAIIIVVTGIIIISSVIFYNIEAASTRITANFNDYFLRQSAQNVAQSGVNLALRQLTNDRTWRAGFTNLAALNGRVTVTARDTLYRGIGSIVIQSTGIVEVGSRNETQATSIAYTYFPPSFKPTNITGLLTLNAANQVNGNIELDGRDHDLQGNIIAGLGTYAISTTGPSFTLSGSAEAGGTVSSVDYSPSTAPPAGVIQVNQPPPPGGFPGSPDSALGGPSNGYNEGTLKAIAVAGVAGSQYVTDPAKIKYPLSGVTYVELPANGTWNPPGLPAGMVNTGILIVHNASRTATVTNMSTTFKGIMVADNVVHLHGDFYGAIISLTTSPTGNVIGNGSARIMYSNEAITSATGFMVNGSLPKVIGWWE